MSTTRPSGSARPAARSIVPKRRLVRRGLPLLVVALVVLASTWMVLEVQVTRRFDGRLWTHPSQIFSDVTVLRPGTPLTLDELTARLDRAGYASRSSDVLRPGQYRRADSSVDIYLREFSAAGRDVGEHRVELRVNAGRLRSIRDRRGASRPSVELEPELLATLFGPRQEERELIRLSDVPPSFLRSVLAAEDARFLQHRGLDPRGILRAALANVRRGKVVQGGSTITQQTVKNLYLGQQRTWWRKFREALMALVLDANYSKERILEVYLNEVYLGQRGPVAICGVQSAARFYFGRDLADLSLSEQALIAGLIRSPGHYNPFRFPERAIERRDQVLDALGQRDWETDAAIEAARAEIPDLASGDLGYSAAAYAVDYVRNRLAELYPPDILQREGLRVYTSLDTRWQIQAVGALGDGLARLERDAAAPGRRAERRRLQGAVLVTDPRSGAILAMVGGRDYQQSQFNRAVQARRQPGSCFKPFIFAAGFEQTARGERPGLTPATLLDDSPLELTSGGKIWRPANYDHEFHGWVTTRQVLEQSLNVPTVRAAHRIGLDRIIESARGFGVESPLEAVPSLALGVEEVTPLELATGYGALAHEGRRVDPWIIREVVARDGSVLAQRRTVTHQAVSPQTAYLVSDILQGVFERGTARSAGGLPHTEDASGKTGTTDDTRDAWFVGYWPDLLALVWLGYDDNTPTALTGSSGALPIWTDLMRRARTESPQRRLSPPRGIVTRRIDPQSGGLALSNCPQWVEERFIEGSEPTQPCVEHGSRFRRWFQRFRRNEQTPGV